MKLGLSGLADDSKGRGYCSFTPNNINMNNKRHESWYAQSSIKQICEYAMWLCNIALGRILCYLKSFNTVTKSNTKCLQSKFDVQIIYKKGMRLGYEINRLTTHGNIDSIDAPG